MAKVIISNALKEVWSQVEPIRKFLMYDHFLHNSIFHRMMSKFEPSMKKLNDVLTEHSKADPTLKTWFYEKNRGKLIIIYDTFRGSFSLINMPRPDRDKYQKEFNQLFIKILGFQKFSQHISKLPTELFTKFIRGITLFENENDNDAHPIYHRNESCGVATLTVDEKFAKGQNKSFLRKCYIERLLYNKIYSVIFGMQNSQHLNELAWVECVYEEQLPGEFIKINVRFVQKIVPISIQISWNPTRTSTCTETYRKLYDAHTDDYKHHAFCSMVLIKNGVTKVFEKVQDYEKESPWIEV